MLLNICNRLKELIRRRIQTVVLLFFGSFSAASMAQGFITYEDYPAEARRHKWEGTSSFTVIIDSSGNVGDCIITQSSGHAVLDEATCSIIKRRAHFKAAQDSAGNPIISKYSSKISWVLAK